MIMPNAARLTLPKDLSKKKNGTPISAAAPKQTSCRFVGLSSGATVVISQFYGARKADKVHWAVHTSIAFSVIGGIIFMIVGLVGSPWALEAMKTPEDVMGHAVVYIRIYFLGIIVNLVYNMGAGILRAVGDSRRPLYFLIASCFTNIILDVLLVAVLGMGVAGAALATITSQLLSAVLVVLALMKTDDMYKLEWKKVRIDQRMLQRIVRIGIPAGMQSVMYNISNVIIQAGAMRCRRTISPWPGFRAPLRYRSSPPAWLPADGMTLSYAWAP